ncbi:MAG TPA: glycosyltransferase family 4 protein [bacterium]
MKRILYIEGNRDGTVGGSYYSLLYLIQGLDRSKYEPHVLFFESNRLIPEFAKVAVSVRVEDLRASNSDCCGSLVDVLRWPYELLVDVIARQPRIGRIIREVRPDLVHLNNGYSGMHDWMLACRLNGLRIIAHDRGTSCPCSLRTRMLVRLLDAVICVSESFRDNAVRQGLRVPFYRVYNGLDVHVSSLKHADTSSAEVRRSLGVSEGRVVLGMVGNILRWKGQAVVLRALRTIVRNHPDVVCVFVGDVPRGEEEYKRELEEYVLAHGLQDHVVFAGYRKDVADVLQTVSVLVHASISPEPFGRVILEGMAAGKPVVGTDAGGAAEIIVNGQTGLLVPMDDAPALAEALDSLLRDPARAIEMGRRGRRRVIEDFSAARMVGETERVYDKVFASRRNVLL